MKAWILSICGIAFLGVMVDIISPHGKMNTFVKSVFSVIFLFIFVKPILSVKSINNISVDSIMLDDNLLETIENQKIAALELNTKQLLIDNGYKDYGVEIKGNMLNNEINISRVFVFSTSKVLNEGNENININVIANIVSEYLKIPKEVIVFG